MKKLIFGLGVVALGLITTQSCNKNKECVCTDKDGVTQTVEMVGSGTKALKKLACETLNTSWSADGGSCKLK